MDASRLTFIERFLRIFTDVRPGEGRTALLMSANVFLILCAYYFVKPLREGWIAIAGVEHFSKMEVKAYSSFLQSLVLVFVVSSYGRLAERLPRAKLIGRATLFCMSNLLVFWWLQPDFFMTNLPGMGVVFYLWVGMFGVFVVAQFWAFAADLYSDEQGRRLIPLVALGATAGAAAGSGLTGAMVDWGLLPVEYLMIAALIPLGISLWLTRVVDRRGPTGEGTPPRAEPNPGPPEPSGPRRGSLGVVLGSRFLLAIAGITLILNWVNTNGENLLFRVVQDSLAEAAHAQGVSEDKALAAFTRDGTTAFYGNFFFWVNVVALSLQAFVASRLLRYGGFAAILLMLPVVALVSYTAMAIIPVLLVVKMMKVAENATDYSINNTARHVAWLPVPAEITYKGKPTVDSFFARLGDGLAAITVWVGVNVLVLETSQFFAFTVALVLVWLLGSLVVIREHRRAVEGEPVFGDDG